MYIKMEGQKKRRRRGSGGGEGVTYIRYRIGNVLVEVVHCTVVHVHKIVVPEIIYINKIR